MKTTVEVGRTDREDTSDVAEKPAVVVSKKNSRVVHEDTPLYERLSIIFGIAAPMTMSFFLRNCENLIQLFFAGIVSKRTGDTRVLAGLALGLMFFNVSFRSVLVGMATALDTLAAQFNGAQKYFEVVVVVQRTLIVFSLMSIPIGVMWYNVERIFRDLGVDADTCRVMTVYLNINALCAPWVMVNVVCRRYLLAMGISWPFTYAAVLCCIVQLGLCALFVVRFGMGVDGIAWAAVLGTCAKVICMMGIGYRLPEVQRSMSILPFWPLHPNSWSWVGIKQFVFLGFPGTVMVCSEWWAVEAMTMMASLIGPEAVTAQSLLYQLSSMGYMVPACIAVAAGVLVGNAMGAAKKELAEDVGVLCLKVGLACAVLVIGPVEWFAGLDFIGLYSTDAEVLRESALAVRILAVNSLADGAKAVAGGVLRGTGKQKIGAYTNLGCFYVVGLPLGYAFCFNMKMGVSGLMLGLSCAVAVQCGILLYFIFYRQDSIYAKIDDVDANRKYDSVSQEPETETETDTETEIDVTGSECDDIELMVNVTASDTAESLEEIDV